MTDEEVSQQVQAARAAARLNDRTNDYLAALWAAWVLDETDAAEGGVPPERVAERVGGAKRPAAKRLAKLADEGYAKRVRGANPETLRPRPSYVPVDQTAEGGGA